MALFEYKVKADDTLVLPESSEEITTTGTGDVVDPDIRHSRVTTGGAHTVTLADGTVTGQIKEIILISDGGDMTLTPDNFADGTSLTFADDLDYAKLRWSGSDWELVGGAGLAII